MANSYWNSPGDFVAGTLVKASEANTKFNGIESGFEAVEADFDGVIKVTAGDAGVVEIGDVVAVRKNKIVAFNSDGDVIASQSVGIWQGDHADGAGTDYKVRDLVRDAQGRIKLDSIYICNADHTSTGTIAVDTSKWDLMIDMTDVKTSELAASSSATAAGNSETAAGNSATAAGNSETAAGISEQLANDWADKTTGYVSGTDNSAKSWSIGGTGDGDPVGGPAIDWATKAEDSPVTTGPDAFSALHWAAKSAASAAAIDLYDIGFNFFFVPYGETLVSFVATRAFTIAIDLADSQGYAQTAPVGLPAVFSLSKNGAAAFGTFTFAAASQTATLASAAGATFAAGDVLTITTAAIMYNIAEVSLVLVGTIV